MPHVPRPGSRAELPEQSGPLGAVTRRPARQALGRLRALRPSLEAHRLATRSHTLEKGREGSVCRSRRRRDSAGSFASQKALFDIDVGVETSGQDTLGGRQANGQAAALIGLAGAAAGRIRPRGAAQAGTRGPRPVARIVGAACVTAEARDGCEIETPCGRAAGEDGARDGSDRKPGRLHRPNLYSRPTLTRARSMGIKDGEALSADEATAGPTRYGSRSVVE